MVLTAQPRHGASGCASDHSADMIPLQQSELESIEAITSSYIASQYMDNETTTIDDFLSEVDWNNVDNSLINLSLCSTELIRLGRARSAMAYHKTLQESSRTKSVTIVDC